MRQAKLKTTYRQLHDDEVAPFAHDVVLQTTASSYFANGVLLAKPVRDAVVALDAAMGLTAHPSPQQTAEREALRSNVLRELRKLAVTINLDFTGNEAALLSAGLELAGTPTTHREVAAPVALTLTDAPTAGCLKGRCKRPARTAVTLWRYTTDATLPESQWEAITGVDVTLGPFPTGTRVGLKAAALTGSTRVPVYTPVVWRIVQ